MNRNHTGTIKLTALLVILAVAILGGIGAVYSAKAEPTNIWAYKPPVAVAQQPVVTHPVTSELFALVNVERVNNGLPALVDDPRLDASAAAKCADEDTKNYHAHIAPDGTDWKSFIQAQTEYKTAGENLAWNYASSQGVVVAWMNSPLHRKNILNPVYTAVGYAVCSQENNQNYVVQHFRG